jgi:hypothetical protein
LLGQPVYQSPRPYFRRVCLKPNYITITYQLHKTFISPAYYVGILFTVWAFNQTILQTTMMCQIMTRIWRKLMNKYMKFGVIAALLLTMALFATFTYAQGPPNPNIPPDGTPTQGRGGRFGAAEQGMTGRGVNTPMNLMAVDEAEMHAAIADALGISVEAFETAVEDGQTVQLLAADLGIDFADIQAVMNDLHADALQQAVADGLVTQEQADRMASRVGGQMGSMTSRGSGQMQGRGAGNMGAGGHGNGYDGDCINTTP